ncbi:MAG: TAXI family TRAP transporter solute-binding subunit [Pseudomonadota bacterium]
MSFIKTLAFTTALSGLVVAGSAQAQETFVTVGTGGQTGVYFVVGQSIAKLVNRGTSEHGLRVTAPSTGGSIANINAIRAGDMDMGVAQSDWQYHAFNGTSKFEENGPFEDLRAVFSVHPEPFNLVAAADSGIASFDDLEGKRVNIGNPGSGQRGTFEVILGAKGWTTDTFSLAAQLKSSEHGQALCDNKIDAFGFTVGHPNGSLQETFASCAPNLVALTGEPFDTLVTENPFYSFATVAGGTYPGQDADVTTFGVRATFVTSASVAEDTVYTIVKTVFENFDRFKRLHPAFANLKEEEMISQSLSAPLHAGAEKYYKERGWITGS